MPRQTDTGITSGYNKPYMTQPQVGLQVVARPVEDKTSSLEGLSRALGGFFGDVNAALSSVTEAEHLKTMVKIEQENQTQQWEAKKIALEGGQLSGPQLNDLDYVTPYNETKAGAAAAQDMADFELNILPKIGLDQDPFHELSTYIGGKLKGIENKQYAAFYMDGMLRGTSDAIAKNRANLITAKQVEVQNDWKSTIAMDLKTGQITNIGDLMNRVTTGAKLYNPMNPQEGERWAIARVLELARQQDADGTIFNRMTEMLQQPVDATKDNPQGLSFATRFPDAFEAAMNEYMDKTSAGWQKQVANKVFEIDQHLASGDIPGAMALLVAARGSVGDNKQFQGRELQILQEFAKNAEAEARRTRLLGTTAAGFAADPDDVRKGGDEIISGMLAPGGEGPVKAAAMMTNWNMVPPGTLKAIEGNLTKNPEAAAAYYMQVAKPLFDNMPSTFMSGLNENAQFVFNSIRHEESVGNTNPLEAAQHALSAVNSAATSGLKVSSVKLGDPSKPGAEATFEDNLKSALASQFGAPVGADVFQGTFLPWVRDTALRYQIAGKSVTEAAALAQADLLKIAGARVAKLPNADGSVRAVADLAPDTAVKWQPRQLPDGSTYDPIEQFQKDAALPELAFLHTPSDTGFFSAQRSHGLGLAPGDDTKRDGAMNVMGDDGHPKFIRAGQEFKMPAGPTGAGGLPGKPAYTITIPADETAAENMLTEMFGNTGFRLSKFTDDHWMLQYVAPAQPLEDLQTLADKRDLQNQLEDEQIARHGGIPGSPGFKQYFQGGFSTRVESAIAAYKRATEQTAVRDATQAVVGRLQDSGLISQSEGVTKPLPLFGNANEAMDYVNKMIDRATIAKGGMPLEAKDALVDDKYLNVRSTFLKAVEGVRNETYDDTKGNATVGVGINLNVPYNVDFLKQIGVDTDKLKAGKVKLTDEQVHLSFENAVNVAEQVVSRKIKVPLNAYQRTALVSLAYNGPSLLSSDLVDAVNSGDWPTAVKLIEGKSINKSRRKKEATYLGRGVFG